MTDIPVEMKRQGREPDQHFDDKEKLYRRFRPDDFDGDGVAPEAFELPDMSVNREKYGPPEWLLLHEDYRDWGVVAFRVEEIPRDQALYHLGVLAYMLRPEHVPLHNNYPHSEIRVYLDNDRICRESENLDLLAPEFHLRWRERLSRIAKIQIQPSS